MTATQNGGLARVKQEREKSRGVTLSLDGCAAGSLTGWSAWSSVSHCLQSCPLCTGLNWLLMVARAGTRADRGIFIPMPLHLLNVFPARRHTDRQPGTASQNTVMWPAARCLSLPVLARRARMDGLFCWWGWWRLGSLPGARLAARRSRGRPEPPLPTSTGPTATTARSSRPTWPARPGRGRDRRQLPLLGHQRSCPCQQWHDHRGQLERLARHDDRQRPVLPARGGGGLEPPLLGRLRWHDRVPALARG